MNRGDGPIALVKNGDPITIDAEKRQLTLEISTKELKVRRKAWKPRKPRYTRGVLAKYAHGSACCGGGWNWPGNDGAGTSRGLPAAIERRRNHVLNQSGLELSSVHEFTPPPFALASQESKLGTFLRSL